MSEAGSGSQERQPSCRGGAKPIRHGCSQTGRTRPVPTFQCMATLKRDLPCHPQAPPTYGAGICQLSEVVCPMNLPPERGPDCYPKEGGTLMITCPANALFTGEVVLKL